MVRLSTNSNPSNRPLSERIQAAVAPLHDRWYVSDGVRVVGPVSAELLLRGVDARRIPQRCGVARHAWPTWRLANQVREVSALHRLRADDPKACVRLALSEPAIDAQGLRGARGSVDLLQRALELAIAATGAHVGVLHRPQAPFIGLVTACATGPGVTHNLGEVITASDDARQASARAGAQVGHPDRDGWARATARRLCSHTAARVGGVALLPVSLWGQPALVELGRFDHGFRRTDAARLGRVGEAVTHTLQSCPERWPRPARAARVLDG